MVFQLVMFIVGYFWKLAKVLKLAHKLWKINFLQSFADKRLNFLALIFQVKYRKFNLLFFSIYILFGITISLYSEQICINGDHNKKYKREIE